MNKISSPDLIDSFNGIINPAKAPISANSVSLKSIRALWSSRVTWQRAWKFSGTKRYALMLAKKQVTSLIFATHLSKSEPFSLKVRHIGTIWFIQAGNAPVTVDFINIRLLNIIKKYSETKVVLRNTIFSCNQGRLPISSNWKLFIIIFLK